MGNQDSQYFYISGMISISLFLVMLFLAITMLFTPSKSLSFAMKKDTYISISLEVPKEKSSRPKKIEKAAAQEAIVEPKKNIDVNNLFSDVWTKKIEPKKETPKPKNTKRLLDIEKKIKTSKSNDVQSLSEKVNDLEKVDTKNEAQASSTAEQVNEYLAKIQAIVYQYFRVPQNSQGSSVKTVIELNSLGKVLDFRVLSYSNNEALNREVDQIRGRLMHVIFPKNPEHKSSKTIVILISKE